MRERVCKLCGSVHLPGSIVLLQAAFDDLLTVCDCSYPGERSDMYCAVCSARSHITNALAELEKGE